MTDAARNTKELPRLVGYAELGQVYGWQKRSLQRAVSTGKLRRPMIVAGGRAVWYDSDIKDYLARLGGELEAIAVTDPKELLPEQISDAAFDLAARHISNELGKSVSADDVVLGIWHQRSPGEVGTEFMENWTAIWFELEERFGKLDEAQSTAVAYGLFPSLRSRLSDLNPVIANVGLTPIEFAMALLAGPNGFDALISWRDRKRAMGA